MKHRHTVAALPLQLALLLASACATPVAVERPGHNLEAELRDFQLLQQVFREQNTVPQVFDFPGHGRVTVRDVTLDGFPGNEYVRCRFHYQNRTDKPVVQSWVSLDVLDNKGRLIASQASCCIVPVPVPIARGSFFSDELRTQTFGAHLEPGWTWRIRCTSQLEEEEEPLNPPVPERTNQDVHLPPLEIKPHPVRWN
ncbi:MAG: hypothetical protein IT456_22460 [Planctomycetes bacterium]|jgi:hypothetical protein|nr:hypothetical protein [Planctomycetota bacterium]